AFRPCRLGCFTFMIDSSVPSYETFNLGIADSPMDWSPVQPMDTAFCALRRKQGGSVSAAPTLGLLLIRFLFAAPSTARLRRRGDDVRNSGVIHLFIQRRQ